MNMTFFYLPRSIDTIFLMIYEPHRVLEGVQSGGFQDKNCLTKMVLNFSKINFGMTKHKKMSKKYENDILAFAKVKRSNFFGGL